jgi:chemotaxis protein methyltransferase CheR
MELSSSIINAEDFTFIRGLIRQRSAIVLDEGKERLVEARLASLVREHGALSITDLISRLKNQPYGPLHRQVVEAMTTNETSFFRDLLPYEALRKVLIPELMQKRETERRLTIWSAASSTGQEPYSLSMMLRDHFPTMVNSWAVNILGTDISSEVLKRARLGNYSQLEVNRGLPAALLVKYFHKEGVYWRINDDIRKMVEFREMNLAEPWPPIPQADIIMLRNVLIYFDVETKKLILSRIRQVLRPDGYLFMGGAETTLNLDNAYEPVQIDKTVCYRLKST